MLTRLSFRVATAVALVISALALTPLAASARPGGVAKFLAATPVGGALTEAELPGASNPSEPYAAASQAVNPDRTFGREPRGLSGGIGALTKTVNPVTGDLSLSLDDLFVPERGVPLGLSLTYNSYFAAKNGPFGRGWSFNAGMSLTKAPDGSVTISQENGSRVTFQPHGGHYVAAPRVIASLRVVSGAFVFTRGTRDKACPSYSRACVKFFFSEPVGFAGGRLTKITSPDGGLNLVYKTGRLTAVQDPAGRTLSFEYTNHKVSAVTLNVIGGLAVHTSYDANGDLIRFTDAAGGRYRFSYYNHHVVEWENARGAETDIAYDSAGHVRSITDPAGETDFSRSAGKTTVSRPGGYTATAHYMDGRVTRIDEGSNPVAPLATTLISYSPALLAPTAVTDPDGHTSHMTYDSLGHLTSFTDPMGHTSVYHFGAATGITATDPVGTVSKATTDNSGRVVSIAEDTGHPALTQTTIFHYGSRAHPGDVTSVTDPAGHLWRFTYDTFGDTTSSTDPLGDMSSTVYDRMGRPAVNTVGSRAGGGSGGFSTAYTYDAEDRMLSSTDPLGNTQTFSYDPAGNLISTLAGGHQTSYGYDAAGRWTVVSRPDGTHSTVSYRSDGHVGEVCDDGGNCDEYTYDDLGRPASVTDPLGNTSSFVYSPGGLLLSSTDANSVTTSYAHNADGQTTGVSYSDGITHPVVVDFDADGRLHSMTDGTGSSSFTYDPLGRLTHESNGSSATVDYGYDKLDHVTLMKLNSTPTASYTYDAAGRMASVRDRLGNLTKFSYDASSNLIQTLFPGGDVDRDGYDNAGRLVHFSLSDSTSDPASIDIKYTRNLLGQITGDTQTGTGQTNQAYSYDANGQARTVNGHQLTYDPRNNLLQDPSGNTFTYDAADRLASETEKTAGGNVDWLFGFDDNGSRTSASTLDGTRSHDFVWDAAGNLTSFGDGSTTETNTYDGLGRTASSSAAGTGHVYVWASTTAGTRMSGCGAADRTEHPIVNVYCGGVLRILGGRSSLGNGSAGVFLSKTDDSGATADPTGHPLAVDGTVYLYGPEGLPVEQIDGSNNALFYHHDQIGSTRAVTDASGHTVEIVAYDTFGNEAYHSGSVTVPFGFGGAFTDPVSHLVLIGHDYYDPPTGQFLNPRGVELASGSMPRRSPQVGNPSALDVELIFDHFEEGIKLDSGIGYDSFSDFPVAPWLDTYEEGSARGVFAANGAYARARRVSRSGGGKSAVNDYLNLRQVFLPMPGTYAVSGMSSPYAFGGGDPVNAWKEFSPAEEQLKGNPRH